MAQTAWDVTNVASFGNLNRVEAVRQQNGGTIGFGESLVATAEAALNTVSLGGYDAAMAAARAGEDVNAAYFGAASGNLAEGLVSPFRRAANAVAHARCGEWWRALGEAAGAFGEGFFMARGFLEARQRYRDSKATLTAAEKREIQAIAREFRTPVDVVGSRAEGPGRNINSDLPVGRGTGTRSDIDFRVDARHPDIGRLIERLRNVGGGAGSAGVEWGPHRRATFAPYIRFTRWWTTWRRG
jgi:hypothetical protein